MSLVDKFFSGRSRARAQSADSRTEQDRSRQLGTPVLQTTEEQASIRQKMEAELDAQRAQRAQAAQ